MAKSELGITYIVKVLKLALARTAQNAKVPIESGGKRQGLTLFPYEFFNTSDWLVETLLVIAAKTVVLAEVLAALAKCAQIKIREIPSLDKRLTFLITGFAYSDLDPRPVAYVLSNFANTIGCVDEFVLRTIAPSDSVIVEVAGAINELPVVVEDKLRRLLVGCLDQASVLRFAVQQLQCIANDGKNGNLVGTQSNSAIVPAVPNSIVTTTYHSMFEAHTAYGCNVVIGPYYCFYGYEMFSEVIMAGPEIRKQDLCWCGSGLKFKHCHMKKFGAVYARLPGFKKPMYARVFLQAELGWASGSSFDVCSGFQ